MTSAGSPCVGHAAVVATLAHSQRVLHRLLYAHIQLRLLLEVGEGRFLGRALDELADAEDEMKQAEAMTTHAAAEAAMAAGLPSDSEILELIEAVPDDVGHALVHLRQTIQDLLTAVNAERALAREVSGALVTNRPPGGSRQA